MDINGIKSMEMDTKRKKEQRKAGTPQILNIEISMNRKGLIEGDSTEKNYREAGNR